MDTSDFRRPRPDHPIVPQTALFRKKVKGFRVPKGRRGKKPRRKRGAPDRVPLRPPNRYEQAKTQDIQENARDRRERLQLEKDIVQETTRYRVAKVERERQQQAVRLIEGRRVQQRNDRLLDDQARHFTALLDRSERRQGELNAQYQEFVRAITQQRNLAEPEDIKIRFTEVDPEEEEPLVQQVRQEQRTGGLRQPERVVSSNVAAAFEDVGLRLEAQPEPAFEEVELERREGTPRFLPTEEPVGLSPRELKELGAPPTERPASIPSTTTEEEVEEVQKAFQPSPPTLEKQRSVADETPRFAGEHAINVRAARTILSPQEAIQDFIEKVEEFSPAVREELEAVRSPAARAGSPAPELVRVSSPARALREARQLADELEQFEQGRQEFQAERAGDIPAELIATGGGTGTFERSPPALTPRAKTPERKVLRTTSQEERRFASLEDEEAVDFTPLTTREELDTARAELKKQIATTRIEATPPTEEERILQGTPFNPPAGDRVRWAEPRGGIVKSPEEVAREARRRQQARRAREQQPKPQPQPEPEPETAGQEQTARDFIADAESLYKEQPWEGNNELGKGKNRRQNRTQIELSQRYVQELKAKEVPWRSVQEGLKERPTATENLFMFITEPLDNKGVPRPTLATKHAGVYKVRRLPRIGGGTEQADRIYLQPFWGLGKPADDVGTINPSITGKDPATGGKFSPFNKGVDEGKIRFFVRP
tara:strand:+ start:34 stop:2181 length:2148 start_codon:yes stop_codon:yes gene_type:complete